MQPWMLKPESVRLAVSPEDLFRVYGASHKFYRDWRVESAISAIYECDKLTAEVTIAVLPSRKEALEFYIYRRQAIATATKTFPLEGGSSCLAFWYCVDGRVSGVNLEGKLYVTVEFSADNQLVRSALPLFLRSCAGRDVPLLAPQFSFWVDGQRVAVDNPLCDEEGFLIPLRPVFDLLGYQSFWIEKKRQIVFRRVGKPSEGASSLPLTIVLHIGQQEGRCDGKVFTLRVPPFTFNGTTYCSTDLFEKTLGMKIRWDSQSRRLEVTH